MKRKRQLRVSIVVMCIAAATFLHFGTTVTNAYVQDEAQGGPDSQLVVDRDHGRLGGLCTKADPCARITDALAIARAMRYGFDPEIPMLNQHKRIRITVHASANPYLGSSNKAELFVDPYLETLPLFINISNLDLVGSLRTVMDGSSKTRE